MERYALRCGRPRLRVRWAWKRLACAISLLSALSFPSFGAVLNVPADHLTIQAAIDTATHGDEIIVAPGTYVENINIGGKNIVLRSTDPTSAAVVAATVIDGNQAGSVVTFEGSEGTTCVLAGFTITNGRSDYGGGVRGDLSAGWTHATIENNRILGNSAWYGGGGLMACDGAIRNNIISGNAATGSSTSSGGGLYNCNGLIENNTISDNSSYRTGGGILFCQAIIQGNTISGNAAGWSGGGVCGCDSVIRNNTISENTSSVGGAGFYLCHGTIQNNEIWGNTVNASGALGGGLRACNGLIEGNTISSNSVTGYNAHGGGLVECNGVIQGNTIAGNSVYAGGGYPRGGGLHECNGTIRSNTIVGNSATGGSGRGGGVDGCDGPILDNLIENNTSNWGGGLCDCQGRISSNTIRNNHASVSGGGFDWCNPSAIEYNLIAGNTARDGGGFVNCQGLIQYNQIVSNSATYGGGFNGCHGTIQNNVISSNTAGTVGAGLRSCNGLIQNNVVSGNRADRGAGLDSCGGAILNNTIYGNIASSAGGGISGGAGQIRNCILWANVAPSGPQLNATPVPTYSCIQDWTGGGTGNIADDPLLADPANGDFHLTENSPCIDAGGSVSLATDFEGDPRPIDLVSAPRGDGSDIDIGADEMLYLWPHIAFDPIAINRCVDDGTTSVTETLEVWNAGIQTLAYIVETTPSWLTVAPPGGYSDGPTSRNAHLMTMNTASLSAGDYAGTITITDPAAHNSPTSIPVRLIVGGSLTLLSPTGGEWWMVGSVQQVEWESHGPCDHVEIYLRHPGEERLLAIAASQEGANSAGVVVPSDIPPGSDYTILIVWTCCPNDRRDESAALTIAPPPEATVTWPAAGSVWLAGTVRTVTYTCAYFPHTGWMYVDLWQGGNYVRYLTRAHYQNGANSRAVRLPINLPTGSDYRIRLCWMEDTSVYFWSDPFSVAPAPTFDIAWPTSTTVWPAGTLGTVQWTCADFPAPGQMYLDLWQGGQYVGYISRVSFANGSNAATFRLPSDLTTGSAYQLRLCWTDDVAFTRWSEEFTVVDPPAQLTCAIDWPTTGSHWPADSMGTIAWACADFPTSGEMYLDLWRDGNYVRYWTRLPFDNGANSATLKLFADLPPGADYQIRLTWTADTSLSFWSGRFTIPQGRIAWPSAATVWPAGTLGTLTFSCSDFAGPGEMDVELWHSGTPARSLGRVPFQNGDNYATFRLPADLTPASDYEIRMSWTVDPSVQLRSDNFTVVGVPTCDVAWPTTATLWPAETLGRIAWTASNFAGPGEVYIDLWQNGVYLRYLTRATFDNGSNYAIVRLPADVPIGTNYRIRLYWSEDPWVGPWWSGQFEVGPTPEMSVAPSTKATMPVKAGATCRVALDCRDFPARGELFVDLWRDGRYVRYLTRIPLHDGTTTVGIALPADLPSGAGYRLRFSWTEDTAVACWSELPAICP